MMSRSIFVFLMILFSPFSFAQKLEESFPIGKGSTFKLKMKAGGPAIDVSIYVASVQKTSLNIEYFMQSKAGLLPITMWQQFEIELSDGFPAVVANGYVQTKELKTPEKMPPEYLKGFDGVKVNDFLFASEAELNKNKISDETVETPAGKASATHYRTNNNGQTVDYWISNSAKPIGLVKLVSQGEKIQNQNYSLELVSLMNNVKAYIDPSKSTPLSENGKAYLMKPESVR
jgi:hypothetical protein